MASAKASVLPGEPGFGAATVRDDIARVVRPRPRPGLWRARLGAAGPSRAAVARPRGRRGD
jgi:hypothetical protein